MKFSEKLRNKKISWRTFRFWFRLDLTLTHGGKFGFSGNEITASPIFFWRTFDSCVKPFLYPGMFSLNIKLWFCRWSHLILATWKGLRATGSLAYSTTLFQTDHHQLYFCSPKNRYRLLPSTINILDENRILDSSTSQQLI